MPGRSGCPAPRTPPSESPVPESPISSTNSPGHFVWHELLTTDPAAAKAFYATLVGWGIQSWDQDQSCTLWMNGDSPVGGVMALPTR
jgi:predicted enzyme related to lactoylglutathione lyase